MMSRDNSKTSNFKSAKTSIMFRFYVLSFFKNWDTNQGGTSYKRGHYLRKYGMYLLVCGYNIPTYEGILNMI